MDFETIIFQQSGEIGIIQINRPEAKNALNEKFFKELNQLLDTMKDNNDIRVVILTGGEKVFAAGADIKQMANMLVRKSLITSILPTKLLLLPNLIAAIAGYCLGGLELAMSCDILIASSDCKLGSLK